MLGRLRIVLVFELTVVFTLCCLLVCIYVVFPTLLWAWVFVLKGQRLASLPPPPPPPPALVELPLLCPACPVVLTSVHRWAPRQDRFLRFVAAAPPRLFCKHFVAAGLQLSVAPDSLGSKSSS
ncbi:unnamed protein product [Prorocentrum cordatum]|uniref:Secreted protein n=1 Tax=Prorocentrum cordatum TaxID=2364126 RepID=A0ABN9RUC2_9DINO|nr:unnamed protein product [Polarella glacialis]